jgi:hypothetical protein
MFDGLTTSKRVLDKWNVISERYRSENPVWCMTMLLVLMIDDLINSINAMKAPANTITDPKPPVIPANDAMGLGGVGAAPIATAVASSIKAPAPVK